jgi:hypothetical protein
MNIEYTYNLTIMELCGNQGLVMFVQEDLNVSHN